MKKSILKKIIISLFLILITVASITIVVPHFTKTVVKELNDNKLAEEVTNIDKKYKTLNSIYEPVKKIQDTNLANINNKIAEKQKKEAEERAKAAAAAAAKSSTNSSSNNSSSNSTGAGASSNSSSDSRYCSSKASAVFNLINNARSSRGLNSLSWGSSMASLADIRAKEITYNFSHYSAYLGQTMNWNQYGENIAWGPSSSSTVFNNWMGSTPHRNNILDSSYSSVAVSCYNNGYSTYWVLVFR